MASNIDQYTPPGCLLSGFTTAFLDHYFPAPSLAPLVPRPGARERAVALASVDKVERIAQLLGTTPARVPPAWVANRPGVVSAIIGARTLAQLQENVAGLDLRLTPGQTATLNNVSSRSPFADFTSRMANGTSALRALSEFV